MKKNDPFFLHHILDAIQQIREYTREATAEGFLRDRLLQDGVLRQLEIIGEASRNLSSECRETNPDVPWSDMIGMRNRLIHAYFNVSLEIVWEVVENEMTPLEHQIRQILQRQ